MVKTTYIPGIHCQNHRKSIPTTSWEVLGCTICFLDGMDGCLRIEKDETARLKSKSWWLVPGTNSEDLWKRLVGRRSFCFRKASFERNLFVLAGVYIKSNLSGTNRSRSRAIDCQTVCSPVVFKHWGKSIGSTYLVFSCKDSSSRVLRWNLFS